MPTLPSDFTRQGSSAPRQGQQQRGSGSASGPPQEPFLGGFRSLGLDTNIQPDTTAISTSPTSFTGSGSHFSLPQPGGFAQQAPPDINWDECHEWFRILDQDGNGTVSWDELGCGLFNDGGSKFSSRTIYHLMEVFDRDGNGEIDHEEFKHLWRYIAPWRQIFEYFDNDGDGRIDANELGQALVRNDPQLEVGPPILNMLVKKYGIKPPNQHPGYPPRIQMDLDHFMCACIVVSKVHKLYHQWTGGMPAQSRMSRDELLEAVLSLP